MSSNSGFENTGLPSSEQSQPQIRIGKCQVPAEVDGQPSELELFTMTLGDEAIYLVPLKTWSQLDVHKWRAQGKLPGTPPGLDIALNQVKVGGECVSLNDPEACEKLENAFNEWLALERQAALEELRKKTGEQASQTTTNTSQEGPFRFQVGLDKLGQPHIRCLEGKDVVADVACTVPGITSLLNDGLMRKPLSWKVGALRDWLELDGELFRFKDNEGFAALERALNERYHPAQGGTTHDIKVFPNPASTSGLDIQFAAADNGLTENRRRHLDPEAMQLLSDPQRCRILRKGVLVKFTPPTFHFKEKTSDGGERDLEPGPENIVWVEKDGQKRPIDLSQPFSHLGLDATELTSIFNHPSICRRVRRQQEETWARGLDQAA